MKGRWISYSADELAWIESHSDLPRVEMHTRFQGWFDRPEISVDALKALCQRRGWKTGRTGCFEKGLVPANKGRKMPWHPNAARTQFKPGHLPHNTRYLGHERCSKDGYIEVSVAEINPHTGYARRYVRKHRWLWEQTHGPVPDGMRLKCLDGNRQNTDPANWEAIPYALAPRLNGRYGRGYDQASPEVQPLLLTITKLEHKARQSRKGEFE